MAQVRRTWPVIWSRSPSRGAPGAGTMAPRVSIVLCLALTSRGTPG